jgi:DNA topoisomerase-1
VRRPATGNSTSRCVRDLAKIDPDDPRSAAEAVGLRYVSDEKPGIRRKRRGKGWSYHDPQGELIQDGAVRRRIEELAIPPAWTEVWICPSPKGHIQATGRDEAGRKQYRYHERWREVRDATKFHRMTEFGEALPKIRRRVRRDLARDGLPREKVLATVVRLLETTCIRVGNDEYAKENDSFGLTTLRRRHVDVNGSVVEFHFNGKGGKEQCIVLDDERMAGLVRECQEIPGYEVFKYLDEDGERHDVDSGDVNEYLHEIVPDERFTAKDFRTWMGSVHALVALRDGGPCPSGDESEKETKSRVLEAVDHAAEHLCNTRAVCRQFYIPPALLESFEEGVFLERLTEEPPEEPKGLRNDERALLAFLRAGVEG